MVPIASVLGAQYIKYQGFFSINGITYTNGIEFHQGKGFQKQLL